MSFAVRAALYCWTVACLHPGWWHSVVYSCKFKRINMVLLINETWQNSVLSHLLATPYTYEAFSEDSKIQELVVVTSHGRVAWVPCDIGGSSWMQASLNPHQTHWLYSVKELNVKVSVVLKVNHLLSSGCPWDKLPLCCDPILNQIMKPQADLTNCPLNEQADQQEVCMDMAYIQDLLCTKKNVEAC